MSKYIYGLYNHDSDVYARVKNGVYAISVADRRVHSDQPYAHYNESTVAQRLVFWLNAKEVAHGLKALPCKQFVTAEEANAYMLDLVQQGYWVPDRMFFRSGDEQK